MRIRSITRPELSRAARGKAAFGVASRTGVATCAGAEDGCFADGEGGGRDEEYDFELLEGGHVGVCLIYKET
jgi:hypothetical protein